MNGAVNLGVRLIRIGTQTTLSFVDGNLNESTYLELCESAIDFIMTEIVENDDILSINSCFNMTMHRHIMLFRFEIFQMNFYLHNGLVGEVQ